MIMPLGVKGDVASSSISSLPGVAGTSLTTKRISQNGWGMLAETELTSNMTVYKKCGSWF